MKQFLAKAARGIKKRVGRGNDPTQHSGNPQTEGRVRESTGRGATKKLHGRRGNYLPVFDPSAASSEKWEAESMSTSQRATGGPNLGGLPETPALAIAMADQGTAAVITVETDDSNWGSTATGSAAIAATYDTHTETPTGAIAPEQDTQIARTDDCAVTQAGAIATAAPVVIAMVCDMESYDTTRYENEMYETYGHIQAPQQSYDTQTTAASSSAY